jgi:hypothetical protein
MKGIERIKILSSDIKDEQLKSIIDYLLSRTDMNDKYLNEEKSLSQMIKFIMREANDTNSPVKSVQNKRKPDKKEEWVSEGQLTLFDM